MKLKKFAALSLVTAMLAVGVTACGSKTEATDTTTAADASADGESTESAAAETVAADDPEVIALEETEVPEKPALADMGTITLGDYKGIAVEVEQQEPVTDEQVDQVIDNILAANPVEITDRPSQEGDTVNIDYEGSVDGEVFDGGSATGYDLTLGSGSFIDNFEEQLEGHVAGDEVEVNVTFPEDYSSEDLAGKAAVFQVKINRITAPAELTDEFVQSYAETEATTVEEFRAEQKAEIESYMASTLRDTIRSDALEQLVAASTFEPSEAMTEYMEKYMINSMVSEYQMYGIGLADMLNMYGMTVDEFKTEISSMAQQNASYEMAIAQIAADENIAVTDEVLADFAEEYSLLTGMDYTAESMMESFGQEEVETAAIQNAVLKVLEENAVVTYLEPEETTAAEETTAE